MNWLIASNEAEARRRLVFRSGREEELFLLMRRPISTERAYALVGLMLGALPPAAIFAKLFGFGLFDGLLHLHPADGAIFFLCAIMNVTCSLMGYGMGSVLSRHAIRLERNSWIRMLTLMPLLGAAWGVLTGMTGGFFFFGIGTFFGAAFGIPIGALAFLIFAILHRTLQRGGMIEARHLVPLVCSISAIIAVLIWRV